MNNKCKACTKVFSTKCSLSTHFQHSKQFSLTHYELNNNKNNQYQKKHNANSQTNSQKATINAEEKSSSNSALDAEQNLTDWSCIKDDFSVDDISHNCGSSLSVHTINDNNVENNPHFIDNINERNIFSFHNDDCVKSNLLKLMLEIGAPNYAYKQILNWAKNAYNTGYKFNPKTISYKCQIKSMEKQHNLDFLCPSVKTVSLPPDNLMLEVTCYSFSNVLLSLVNNKELNQLSNLVVNPSDPFSKYVPPTGKLGEVNGAHWYLEAYKHSVKDVSKDFLMSIIFAMDKTTISSSANLHVFAIMFTTTIFKKSVRNQAHVWRPLGYIPSNRNYYSGTQWNANVN